MEKPAELFVAGIMLALGYSVVAGIWWAVALLF